MQPRDLRVHLSDALLAAEAIIGIRDEVGPVRLREDGIVRAAIERHLITVGEALNRAEGLEPDLTSKVSHLRAIVGLRNRLVHGYFAIEWSRIVALVEREVDLLESELRSLVH